MEPNIFKSKLPSSPENEKMKLFSEYLAKKISQQQPGKIALIDAESGDQWTFGEIHQKFQELACALVECGVEKEDLVTFFSDNCLSYLFLMFGLIYLGVPMSPVTSANGPFELYNQILVLKSSILVICEKKLPVLLRMMNDDKLYDSSTYNLKLIILMNTDHVPEELAQHPKTPKKILTYNQVKQMRIEQKLARIPFYPAKPKDKFFIIFTSGSTGLPKGVVHSQYSWLSGSMVRDHQGPEFRVSMSFPLSHLSGSCFAQFCLNCGFTAVFIKQNELKEILSNVERYKINYSFMTSHHLISLANDFYEKLYDLSSLKMIGFGGMKIPENVQKIVSQKFPQTMFLDSYGSTEFFGGIIPNLKTKYLFGSVGEVNANCEMKIIDLKTGENLPRNQNGEICLRGPPCFIEYLGDEKATKEAIDADNWYHTGDIGFVDENDHLHIAGRLKEIIKFRQWSVGPSEIEEILYTEPSVEKCCVVGVPHKFDGQVPRAYIQLKPEYINNATEQQFIDLVEKNLGFQRRLRGGVKFVSSMPLISIGKIERNYFTKLAQKELLTDVE